MAECFVLIRMSINLVLLRKLSKIVSYEEQLTSWKRNQDKMANAEGHDKRTYPNGIRTLVPGDGKIMFVLEQAMKDHRGSKAIDLDGVNATPVLPLRKRPGFHCTGGWVSPRTGLEGCEKIFPTGIRSSDRPARSELLYRLRYPCVFLLMEGIKQLKYRQLMT